MFRTTRVYNPFFCNEFMFTLDALFQVFSGLVWLKSYQFRSNRSSKQNSYVLG